MRFVVLHVRAWGRIKMESFTILAGVQLRLATLWSVDESRRSASAAALMDGRKCRCSLCQPTSSDIENVCFVRHRPRSKFDISVNLKIGVARPSCRMLELYFAIIILVLSQ